MAEASGLMDNITMRELRGTVMRLEQLIRQIERTQNQQASQIAQITATLINTGQSVMTMQFWGNQLSSALEKGHPLGVAIPVMGAVSMGIGRGLQAAQQTQKMGEAIRRGEIQFGTEADKQRYAVEQTMRTMASFIFGI
jgi:hypothetical protein